MKCSFCRKQQAKVSKLIANHRGALRRVYICGACVGICNSILNRPLAGVSQVPPENVRRVAVRGRQQILHCSFCKKPQHTVGMLIESPTDATAHICKACVEICNSILANDGQKDADDGVGATLSGVPRKSQAGARRWWQIWRRIGLNDLE